MGKIEGGWVMGNKDGIAKNIERVKEGFEAAKAEWAEIPPKLLEAIKNKDPVDFIHHLSDYRGAGTEHLWRLHFYLFWPKWILVGVLIWAI